MSEQSPAGMTSESNGLEAAGSSADGAPFGRRDLLKALAACGVGSAVFQRALAAQAADNDGRVSAEMIRQAEWVAGLELTDEERAATAEAVHRSQASIRRMREFAVGYDVPPAVAFRAAPELPSSAEPPQRSIALTETAAPGRPESADDLAFLPVTELAPLMRERKVSSVELTHLYLERLRRYDPLLLCVVNYTDDLAMRQAEQADREIAAGRYRGPLHGIPWGAKDLIACPGYPTTWGAPTFREQLLDGKATVVRRLEQAGAVLVAKLSLGALAMGDRWFGGMTRNPWDVNQGSSGSSAGSAAATAAGLVGFALGSETLGSIVSPCRRCGTTGLRPTFGRVSRHGCMALAWSMDKIGPITRTVEDSALVFAAIHGADRLDPTAVTQPFEWPFRGELPQLRVGYVADSRPVEERDELKVLQDLGVRLVPIELPDPEWVGPLSIILNTESAAVFDELTRLGVTEGLNSWPNSFRQGQFVPAVEYLRANRIRTLVMRAMQQLMEKVDVYVGGDDLLVTNLTGHPTVVLPAGFRKRDELEVPYSVTFTGQLFGESKLLALAHAYQQATAAHLRRPPLDSFVPPAK